MTEKNIYRQSRENAGLTREEASELIGCMSPNLIEKIENGKVTIAPEHVLQFSIHYKDPSLCNYYCSHDCPLGQEYVTQVDSKNLEQISLEILNDLNTLVNEKDKLIGIAVDGDITEDEFEYFRRIHDQLTKMEQAIDSLQLWIDKKIGDGKLNGSL